MECHFPYLFGLGTHCFEVVSIGREPQILSHKLGLLKYTTSASRGGEA